MSSYSQKEPSIQISESEEQNDKPDGSQENLINSNSMVSHRITIAGVFFDIALFVADVEHLKFVIDSGKAILKYYNLLLGLLITSLFLQLLVGALLFFNGFRNVSHETKSEAKSTKILNHVIIGLVSAIALVNIIITVFADREESISKLLSSYNCSST